MRSELKQIQKTAESEIRGVKTLGELEARRIQFLGRERGALTMILRRIKDLSPAERRVIGQEANRLRGIIEKLIAERAGVLKRSTYESSLKKEWLDVTRPGIRRERGHLHPITKVLREVEVIFASMGFFTAEGPEVETEYYNFDALNIPEHHPARDQWDTLWLKPAASNQQPATSRKPEAGSWKLSQNQRLLLRTHTSPVQIRYMEAHNPPLAIIVPGRVYRHEATDATHEIQFYQLEGLMVDKNVSIANFKSVIQQFFSRLFGEAVQIRLKPSYYPFTEPSFDVEMRSAHWPKWLEAAGAGMVHPNVFKAVGYNPREWQGFAFGMGVDRIAMMKYKIPDIRLFHSGDLRFLKQF